MVTPYTSPFKLIGYVPPWTWTTTITICFSSKWLIYINKLFSVEVRNEKHLMRELLNCVSGKLWFESGWKSAVLKSPSSRHQDMSICQSWRSCSISHIVYSVRTGTRHQKTIRHVIKDDSSHKQDYRGYIDVSLYHISCISVCAIITLLHHPSRHYFLQP